ETAGGQCTCELVAAEHAYAGEALHERAGDGRGQGTSVAAREQRDPAAPRDLIDGSHRTLDQVQRSEAADRVDAALAERQRAGVPAQVGDIVGVGLLHRARQHRPRRVETDYHAVARGAGETAREVAGAAGHVQYPLAARE